MGNVIITIARHFGSGGRTIVRKKRGKLTVEEIREALYDAIACHGGCYHFALIVKAAEDIGYQGWDDAEDDPGDAVELWEINESDTCPFCGQLTPPFDYCPNCGTAWRDLR